MVGLGVETYWLHDHISGTSSIRPLCGPSFSDCVQYEFITQFEHGNGGPDIKHLHEAFRTIQPS